MVRPDRRAPAEAKAAEEKRLAELNVVEEKAAQEKAAAEAKAAEVKRIAELNVVEEKAAQEKAAAEAKAAEKKRLAELKAAEEKAAQEKAAAEAKAAEKKRLAELKAAEEKAAQEKAAAEAKAAEKKRLADLKAAEDKAAQEKAAAKAAEEVRLAELNAAAEKAAQEKAASAPPTFDAIELLAGGQTVLAGRAPAGSTVRVEANGKLLGIAKASIAGEWTLLPSFSIDLADQVLVAIAQLADGSGREIRSAEVKMNDKSVADAGVVVGDLPPFDPDLGAHSNGAANGEVGAMADAASTVFSQWLKSIGSEEANEGVGDAAVGEGNEKAKAAVPAADKSAGKSASADAAAKPAAGEASEVVEASKVTEKVAEVAAATAEVVDVRGAFSTVIYEPAGDKKGWIRAAGFGSPDATLGVIVDGNKVASVEVTAGGTWKADIDFWIPPGTHKLELVQIKPDGSNGAPLAAIELIREAVVAAVPAAAANEASKADAGNDASAQTEVVAADPEKPAEPASTGDSEVAAAKAADDQSAAALVVAKPVSQKAKGRSNKGKSAKRTKRKSALKMATAHGGKARKRQHIASAGGKSASGKSYKTRKIGSLAKIIVIRTIRVFEGANGVVRYKVRKGKASQRMSMADQCVKHWHRVKRGETLWGIARKYYGKGSYCRLLIAANRKRVPDPRRMRPNQRIAIV